MIAQIKKRYGNIVDFNKVKITNAIYRAAREGGGESKAECDQMADKVLEKIDKEMPRGAIPTVEGVQDLVEQVLIETGHAKTAKAYIIYRQKRAEIRAEKMRVLEKDEIDEVDKKFDVNALRVLKARYLRKDDHGRLIETPKQLFTRVAVNTGLAEIFYDEQVFDKDAKQEQHQHEGFEPQIYEGEIAIGKYILNRYHLEAVKRMYDRFNRQHQMKVPWSKLLEMLKDSKFNNHEKTIDEFYDIMVNRQFMPNTPAIANFGSMLGMGSACFHPDQVVITKDGPRKISDVKVNDEVLTHKGRFRKVKEIFIRETNSLLSFECRKLPKSTLLVTDEHPILAFKDGEVNWYPAYMIREGDSVALSYSTETKDIETIKVSDIVQGIAVNGDECSYEYKGGKFNAFVHTTKPVKNVIGVDYDLMKLFGFYLSEGTVSEDDCVRFTLSSDEMHYCREIVAIMEKKFGITARIETNKDPERKWLSLRFHSTILAKFFENMFGTGYNRKKIPAWIMSLPVEKQKGLMSGMIRGDGTVFKNSNKMNARLVMSNTDLVYAFWQMCMRCGVFAALGKENMNKLARTQPFRCTLGTAKGQLLMNELLGTSHEVTAEDKTLVVNGVVFAKIEKIEKIDYAGPVYNLEVEEDHSYVANMVSVHNCFVLSIEDDLTSIMDTLKHTALIHQAGGGSGFNFSKLRPEGDIVKSTCGAASGPISFMQLYDNMTDVIKQGGMRRGANMGILNSNHPDIEKFITAKEGNKALRNFNISVLIMGDFWDYYEKDEPYPLVNPRTGQVERTVSPRMLFDKIVYQAWESAEPGVIFFDKVNEFNPFLEHLGPIVTTNPCVAADTKILTEDGWIEIEKLANMGSAPKLLVDARTLASGERQMQAGLLAVKAVKIWKTGEKETLVLTMESGKELTATPDHRILTRCGWVPLSEIRDGEKIFVQNGNGEALEESMISIRKGDTKAVYDITEPITHSFIANGIIVHNCGEVLLYPNEPCNLGSINVWAFAKENESGDVYVDWDDMARVTKIATKFLDNVIDVNKWPLKQIEDMALSTRKVGVGVMGVGDLLFELGLPYNNDDGRTFMEQLMEFVNYWTKVKSIELAKERGPLPFLDKSFYPQGRLPFRCSTLRHFDWPAIADTIKKHGIRNGYTTIIAPTGSISMIAGCSSGIEPVYSLVFEKNVKVGSFYYIDPVFEKVMKREGLFDEALMAEIAENRGSIQNIPYIPQHLKNIFVTAMDATPESHIRALAAFQTWVDSSISKTNNFPANATVDDMRQSYLLAYQLGCKDVTVFRDSSIKEQVLVAPKSEKVQEAKKERYVLANETVTETATGTLLQRQNNIAQKRTNEPNGKFEYTNCPTCDSAVAYKEGCVTCESCGWGLCG